MFQHMHSSETGEIVLAHPSGCWEALGDGTLPATKGLALVGNQQRGRDDDYCKLRVQRHGML